MSYVVHALAVDPLPRTVDEAFSALKQANNDALEVAQAGAASSGKPPTALATLAERLWVLYPQDAYGQVDHGGPWLEGLPAPSPDSRVWSLGLNTRARQVERAYEQLLNHCAALGLVLLDSQRGVGVLPDRTVLGGVLVVPKAPEIEYDPEDFVPGGRVSYYPRETAEAALNDQVRDDLQGFMHAHGFAVESPISGWNIARFRRVNGELHQSIDTGVTMNHWTVLYFGGGVTCDAGVAFPDRMRQIEKICRPPELNGKSVDLGISSQMNISLEKYLRMMDPNYLKDENPDYFHVPASDTPDLKKSWRNLEGSDLQAPSMISYRDGLTFTNQYELYHATLPRLRRFIGEVVLPIFDRLGSVADIADYAIETFPQKIFHRDHHGNPEWMAMGMIAVGMTRPERLGEFAVRFGDFMTNGYPKMISEFSWFRNPEDRERVISAYQSHFREYTDAILSHFGQKRP